jgi:dipeptidase
MCDTFVATPDFTSNGKMLFGKNSDREPNEAQSIVRYPASRSKEKKLQVTHIEIPQSNETYEIILSKPFQMWGAEMGANEHGLTIGNEAIFSKIKFAKLNKGLTGMDMLRLALERTKSAETALELITSLVEEYGQDACAGYEDKNFYYFSSYIIADAKDAWLLETAGEQWAAKKIKGFRSISNGLTLENDYDLSSKNLISFAQKKGWVPKNSEFNFRKAYSDWFMTYFSFCKIRQALSTTLGNKAESKISFQNGLSILRSHGTHDGENFSPAKSDMGALCLHATGITTPSQTTGSLLAEISTKEKSVFWFTGTSAPCLSIYKPFYFPGKSLSVETFSHPSSQMDQSLWWRHEKFHRKANHHYQEIIPIVKKEQSELENSFYLESEKLLKNGTPANKDKFSLECLTKSDSALNRWTEIAQNAKSSSFHPLYKLYWNKQNKKAKLYGI